MFKEITDVNEVNKTVEYMRGFNNYVNTLNMKGTEDTFHQIIKVGLYDDFIYCLSKGIDFKFSEIQLSGKLLDNRIKVVGLMYRMLTYQTVDEFSCKLRDLHEKVVWANDIEKTISMYAYICEIVKNKNLIDVNDRVNMGKALLKNMKG